MISFIDINIFTIITQLASIVTTLGIIFAATKKGRAWLLNPVLKKCDDNTRNIKRLELLMMIDNHPEMVQPINMLYDEYHKMGGNSYVSIVYNVWRQNVANGIIQDRMSFVNPSFVATNIANEVNIKC